MLLSYRAIGKVTEKGERNYKRYIYYNCIKCKFVFHSRRLLFELCWMCFDGSYTISLIFFWWMNGIPL